MRDPDQAEAMVASALDTLGRLDVAHNNAGVPGPYRPFWEYTETSSPRCWPSTSSVSGGA